MNDPQEFDALRRLLALKSQERPPASFFNGFADRVMARIEVECPPRPRWWWLSWLWEREFRPAIAYAYASLLLASVGVGLTFAHRIESESPQPAWVETTVIPGNPVRSGLRVVSASTSPAWPLSPSIRPDRASSVRPVVSSGPETYLLKASYPSRSGASAWSR